MIIIILEEEDIKTDQMNNVGFFIIKVNKIYRLY
jgi:hypothetical protein